MTNVARRTVERPNGSHCISNSRAMRTVDWSSFDRADKTERRFENGISLTSTTNGWKDAWGTVERSSVRVYRVYEWAYEESEEGLQGEKQLAVEDFFRSSHRSESIPVMSKAYWDLKSCWSIRRPRYPFDRFVTWLLEHEVIVSGGPPHVQVVAKFVHALLNTRMKRGYVMRGGLVSLRIRKRWDAKKLDGCKKVKLVVRLKGHSA